jgi:hypothetical protein
MVIQGTSFAKINWQESITPSNDRVLLLSDKKGTKINRLHAKTEGALWYVHFEDGRLPEPLKQKWTKYSSLLKAVKTYYGNKKNQNGNPDPIEITEQNSKAAKE